MKRSHQAVIFDQLLDSNPLLLTGNTDTVYCTGMLDLDFGPMGRQLDGMIGKRL